MRLVLLGLPGSGKGTQGGLLAAHYEVPHIATGDILRDHIARGTEFGMKVQAAIAAGNFAPDGDVLFWVCDRLSEPDARAGYILDGFPRDLVQAKAFDARNELICESLDAVVELAIDEAVLLERLQGRLVCAKCGETYHVANKPPRTSGQCDLDGEPLHRRPDDEPEAVRQRFLVYRQLTQPLSEYYAAAGVYVAVDAQGPSSEVFERVRLSLEGRKNGATG